MIEDFALDRMRVATAPLEGVEEGVFTLVVMYAHGGRGFRFAAVEDVPADLGAGWQYDSALEPAANPFTAWALEEEYGSADLAAAWVGLDYQMRARWLSLLCCLRSTASFGVSVCELTDLVFTAAKSGQLWGEETAVGAFRGNDTDREWEALVDEVVEVSVLERACEGLALQPGVKGRWVKKHYADIGRVVMERVTWERFQGSRVG